MLESDSGERPTLRDLYPHFTDEQLLEAKERLDRYLDLMLRVFERIRSGSVVQGDGDDEPSYGESERGKDSNPEVV